MLKLLGIFETYKCERNNQAGKADGFLKFKNLAVIYDCTLRSNYLLKKNPQISNYCRDLESSNNYFQTIGLEIKDSTKQVWIITRGETKKISRSNQVEVKEISIETLIKLYNRRMNEDMTENDFELILRQL